MGAPVYWEQKDPDETVNYAVDWASQLSAGDTIATSAWSAVTGATLVTDSIGDPATSTVARVSGGADGVTASLLNTVTTADGETLEQVVVLPIVANSSAPLTAYQAPRPQDLLARYPAFAAVPYSTLAVHLADALTGVDTSWDATDYPIAVVSLAAHNMALLGIGETDERTGYARAGVSSLRDGAFSVSFNDKAVSAASGGGFDATPYGRQYKILLRRNKGGPRLVGGAALDGGWGPLAQLNNGGIVPWAY